ncbi:MAG: hypothetical protein HRF46_00065 [Acidobacteriota bacterium]|jgi:hypothetical protein
MPYAPGHPSLGDCKKRVIAAIVALYKHDQELLDIDASERSISHKLAEHLQREFPYWHVDCEYNRRDHAIKRLDITPWQVEANDTEAKTVFPDIIIHRRRSSQNLIVLEIKKASGREETKDEEKLRSFTSAAEYRYKLGLFLRIGDPDHTELVVYEKGSRSKEWTAELRQTLEELGYGG